MSGLPASRADGVHEHERHGPLLSDAAGLLDVPEDLYASWSPAAGPGDAVAFVSDRTGEPMVWIRPAPGAPLQLLPVAPPRVLSVSWSPNGAWLALVTAAPGRSRHEVWVVRPDGSDLHRLAGGMEIGTAVLADGPRHGWTVDGCLMMTETNETSTALIVDLDTGRRTVLAAGLLLTLLDVSPSGQLALLRRGPRCARDLLLLDVTTGRQRPLGPSAGPGSTDHACFAPDGGQVYARSDAGRDYAALLALPLEPGGASTVVAYRPGQELAHFTIGANGRNAALIWTLGDGRSALSLLDLSSHGETRIARIPRDVVDDCRLTSTGQELIMTAESWADPKGIWALSLPTGEVEPVSSSGGATLYASRGSRTPSIKVTSLTEPQSISYRADDGLTLQGWLYPPTPPPPWPTIIHLHGGPEAQERPVYNSLFQSLVAAGYAVFAPNVRGSTGFGRAFTQADDRELRFGAIDDVRSTAEHLIAGGFAVPERLGCMGRSYGGYLTLAALTWFPSLFAVGVDVCGMVDLMSFYRDTEPWIGAAAMSKYGHPDHDEQLLRDLSPIHRMQRLEVPLMVVHGGDDTNVPVSQAEQLVATLSQLGKQHRYLLFEGEGHELLDTANRVSFVDQTLAWLELHLGPAAVVASDAAPAM